MVSSPRYYLKAVSLGEHLGVENASGTHIPRTGVRSLQCLGPACGSDLQSYLLTTSLNSHSTQRWRQTSLYSRAQTCGWKNPHIFLSILCYGLKIHFLNEFWKLLCDLALWSPWTGNVDNLLFSFTKHYARCFIYIDIFIYHSKSMKRKLRFREFEKANFKACNGSILQWVLWRDYDH